MAQQPQQQQYVQYTQQPVGSYPGATVYAYPGGQPAQVIQMQPTVLNSAHVMNNYNQDGARAALVLGIIQFIIGCACICFQSGSSNLEGQFGRAYLYTVEFLGTGIWCGILFLLTGIFGICAGKQNTPGLIITFMVFNVISSLAIWILLSFAATNVSSIRQCKDGEAAPWFPIGSTTVSCSHNLYSVWMAMDGLMVALALIEFIVALTSAAYCCKAVCTCCRSSAGMVIQQPASGVYLPTTTAQQQVLGQQQQFVIQQQHLPAQGMPYPVQAAPYGQYPGGMPGPAAYAPPYPQQATGTLAQYPAQHMSAYGAATAAPAGSAASPQAHTTPSGLQPTGAGYSVVGGHLQPGGGVAQPPYPTAPVAPDAHSDVPDVKSPLLPPDYSTALKL